MRLKQVVGVFRRGVLPFAPAEIVKGASFIDSFPDIPFGHRNGRGEWVSYSRAEREALHTAAKLKAERAAKKAAKGTKAKPKKPKQDKPAPLGLELSLAVVQGQMTWDEAQATAKERIQALKDSLKDEPCIVSMRPEPAIQTVKRGGKWVQVGSDNLTAHIESQ